MGTMVPIADSEAVTIFCPREGKYSFFNSPFPAHSSATGMDIYPGRGFGEKVPSPVAGRVLRIRKVRCPKGWGFRASGFDYVILLQSSENPERVVKLLHVDPFIRCGEIVEPGQEIGRLLRSGYFNYWTEPHIHLEVRRPSDPIRARGGFLLHSLLDLDDIDPVEELRGVVTACTPEYSVIALEGRIAHGLPADVGGVTGLLDGGIPHYGFVGAHLGRAPSQGRVVRLGGKPIAEVDTVLGNMCLAKCTGLSLTVDGIGVGLSLYLFPASRLEVKLVPRKIGALELQESREVSLAIS